MTPRCSRARETVRRLAAGLALTIAAGVGLGDDVQSERSARRGSRELPLDLPHLGTTRVHVPRTSASGVVLLLHRGGSAAERTALTDAVPGHVLLVDVDVSRLPGSGAPGCDAAAHQLDDISRRAQRDAGLTRYLRPVIVASAGALPAARTAVAGAGGDVLPSAVAVGAPADEPAIVCGDDAQAASRASSRWSYAPAAAALASPLDRALRIAALDPPSDATPVQRWLRHFDLPLTAAWSPGPRGMLVLLSPARGWRAPEEALARQLAAQGVSVVGIDALRSFWQRRSPRDVALELQRLTDALARTGLPVFIGGSGFGAETMAVAGEMMPSRARVAGVVLVDPAPTAFFEVEPPALALRPMGPSNWSTRAAVMRLAVPTLCISPAPDSSSALLCASLARTGRATFSRLGSDTSSLAHTIGAFITAAPAGAGGSGRQPRKPSTRAARVSWGSASTSAGDTQTTR